MLFIEGSISKFECHCSWNQGISLESGIFSVVDYFCESVVHVCMRVVYIMNCCMVIVDCGGETMLCEQY